MPIIEESSPNLILLILILLFISNKAHVLLVLSNTPHAMDKSGVYEPSDIEITIFDAVAFDDEDYKTYSDEAKRGFINTNRYFV